MSIERLKEYLAIDRRSSSVFYLKSPSEGLYIRRPIEELAGYRLLAPYLRMPRARLAKTKEGPLLVVAGIDAPTASELSTTDPQVSKHVLEQFLVDVENMWYDTARPMDEGLIARNWRVETMSTLERLKRHPKITTVINDGVVVNGVHYPSLGDTLELCTYRLAKTSDARMVLCHGDEHLENLLAGEDGYWAIDPGEYSGYNSPSSTVNNLVGGSYLFLYKYQGEVMNSCNNLSINYKIAEDFQIAESVLRPTLKRSYNIAREILGGSSLSKELLFANELRVAVGWVNRSMDLVDIYRTGMIYAGIATEHYYSSDIV